MEEASDTAAPATEAPDTASAIVDTLRYLLSVSGALLGSEAGQAAAQDAVEVRSLPALAKSLRRLWFNTKLEGQSWDSKEQAVWLSRLLAVTEGSRAGVLSFYGAGLLLVDSLAVFAEVCLAEAGAKMDEAFLAEACAVQDALRGAHWDQLQQWPADRLCGGGKPMPLLSANRLPCTMRRAFDLEGMRMTKAHVAGMGVAMLIPGSMTLAMGGVGTVLVMRKAKEQRNIAALKAEGGVTDEAEDPRWKALQVTCLDRAHQLYRRKTCPIDIRYQACAGAPAVVKVSLYSLGDPFCAMPVGSVGGLGGGTGGDSMARLSPDERCALRPSGSEDSFRMRVYRPALLLDEVLHDGVEVKRGDRLVLMAKAGGNKIACYADSVGLTPNSTGEAQTEGPRGGGNNNPRGENGEVVSPTAGNPQGVALANARPRPPPPPPPPPRQGGGSPTGALQPPPPPPQVVSSAGPRQ